MTVQSSADARHAGFGGLVSGLGAGALLTAVMTLMSGLAGKDVWYGMKGAAAPFLGQRAMAPGFDAGAVALGLFDHLAISAAWGIAFGLIFYGLGKGITLLAGVLWAVVVWAGMYMIVLPAAGLGAMTHEVSTGRAIMFHLFYSVPLALLFPAFQPHAQRARPRFARA